MQIKKVSLFRLEIPFRQAISHNLAKRKQTETIVVVLEDETGILGFGEGTPRSYVTGESIDSAAGAVRDLAVSLIGCELASENLLLRCLEEITRSPAGQQSPSASCAIEIAMLDLWCRRRNIPLWQLFTPEKPAGDFYYSAVIPFVTPEELPRHLSRIKQAEIQQVKVKVADDPLAVAALGTIREDLGPSVGIRIDANGAFSADRALEFMGRLSTLQILSFEQPVDKNDLPGLKRLTAAGLLPIMADESLCSLEDAARLVAEKACNMFNVRLSKCGGLLNCLAIVKQAQRSGLSCQMGCHIGETAILAAAGRHFAALCPDLVFLEGSFSRYLLQEDLSVQDISFGHRGKAPLLCGPGLGIDIDAERLNRLARPLETCGACAL